MGKHAAYDFNEQYICKYCGEYGDHCGCGPEVYGCTMMEKCPVDWHTHNCYNDRGNCDQPERHMPSVQMPIVPMPWGEW